jgi:hypothetical protein
MNIICTTKPWKSSQETLKTKSGRFLKNARRPIKGKLKIFRNLND